MNREILFRGKQFYDGEWIYGSLLEDDIIVTKGATDVDEDYIGFSGEWSSVDSETVGQFTGVTDKNGNKIFEGDIVDILCENEETGLIECDKDTARFIVSAYSFEADFDNYYGTDLEVIGNIHDNPELIKRDEQKN